MDWISGVVSTKAQYGLPRRARVKTSLSSAGCVGLIPGDELRSHMDRGQKSEVAQLCPTLRPRGWQPARLLCPWDSPGKNTGAGCHVLLQASSPSSYQTCVYCIDIVL